MFTSGYMENMKESKGNYGCIHTKCDVKLDTNSMEIFSEYAEVTYMHGPSAIKRSKFIVRRIFWVLVFIFGCVMTVFQIHSLFVNYFGSQISTTNEYKSAPSLKFPAVTICNLNPIRRSMLALAGTDIKKLVSDLQTTSSSYVNWTSLHNSPNYYKSYSKDINDSLSLLYYYKQLPKANRTLIGHHIETMLMSCTFNGMQCSPANFSHSLNPAFGNCYTFNAAKFSPALFTEQIGPLYGLALSFLIEEEEYLDEIQTTSGMRVVVHDQSEMPFPEDEGISLSAGFLTSVGISRIEFSRSGPTYELCNTYTEEENRMYNAYFDEETLKVGYSVSACMRTCYQKHIIRLCNCCSCFYPCKSFAYKEVIRNKAGKLTHCLYSDAEQDSCVKKVNKLFDEEKFDCNLTCSAKCREVKFRTASSIARFPFQRAINDVINILKSRSVNSTALLSSKSSLEQQNYVERNVLKINIYYETMTYEKIITEPVYKSENLISDIGGQFGLWLGLSMVSVFEFLEMIVDIFAYIILKCRHSADDAVKTKSKQIVRAISTSQNEEIQENNVDDNYTQRNPETDAIDMEEIAIT